MALAAIVSWTLRKIPSKLMSALYHSCTEDGTAMHKYLAQVDVTEVMTYLLMLSTASAVYYVFFHPLNRVKSALDIGWSFLGSDKKLSGKALAERVNEVQKLRKNGDLPPVFPNGWFSVVESNKVKKKKVVSVQVLGETLAVFRSEDDKIHVVDAYCPHLGANMAAGGVVKGDCIECPFHGWLFSGTDGQCTHVPYMKKDKKAPDFAKVRHWDSRELNGHVFIWYDAERRPPQWELPTVQEVVDGKWMYRGRTQHDVLAHVQEIPENGADVAHLGHLHVPNIFKGADLTKAFASSVLDIARHQWQGEWQVSEESHITNIEISHHFRILKKYDLFKIIVKVEQIGPGLVYLHFNSFFGKGVLVQTVTPLEPLKQRIIHRIYTNKTFIAPIAKLVLLLEALHVERDIMIWNNKQYMSRPLLVAEDKLIGKFRRWYTQFYSENSPRFHSFRKDDILDW